MKIKTTLALILLISFTNVFAPATFPVIEEGKYYIIVHPRDLSYRTLPEGTKVYVLQKIHLAGAAAPQCFVSAHKTSGTRWLIRADMLQPIEN